MWNIKPEMRARVLLLQVGFILFMTHVAIGAKAQVVPEATQGKSETFVETRDRLLEHSRNTPLNAKEQFELSVALFGNGEFGEARVVAELGIGLTSKSEEKALFHLILAQSLGALGDYKSAAQTALAGQRFDPFSKELASLRWAYFHNLGDQAQQAAAEDTLKHLQPSGTPVLSAGQLIATVTLIGDIIRAIYEVGPKVAETWRQIKPEVERIAVEVRSLWTNPARSPNR